MCFFRRELPDYYQTIMEPISLNQIKRKIRNGEYKNSVKLLAKDMDLMFENCKEYNRPDSKLYKVSFYKDLFVITKAKY